MALSLLVASAIFLLQAGGPLSEYHREEAEAGTLYWRGWAEGDREGIVRILPAVVRKVEERLERRLKKPFTTVLAPNGQEFRRVVEQLSGEPPPGDMVVGVAIPALHLLVIRGAVAPGAASFRTTLAHEVAHLIIHQDANSAVPRWLDEGVATWASDPVLAPYDESCLALLARIGGLYHLRDLETRFPPGHHSTSLAYQQSLLLILYLENQQGRAGMLRFLDEILSGRKTDSALLEVFGLSARELEKGFSSWVAGRRGLGTALLSLLNIWTLTSCLALVAIARYLVRRRRRFDELDTTAGDDADPEGGDAGDSNDPAPLLRS